MRILVAEDNTKLAQALKLGLEAEQYAVDVFHDGQEALLVADGDEYDLLILDRMMPGADGLTICRTLREDGVTTPILFLTAKDAVSDRVDGLDAGADDYLIKPFAFAELLARVRSLLRREQEESKTGIIHYDSLSLDPAKKVVTRATQQLKLTAKEYALLNYLLRNAEHTISSSQILDHVWNQDYDGMSNIVQTYIKQIRNKVDKPFPKEKPLIQTVRGFGYKVAVE